jgi:hypothetical protein
MGLPGILNVRIVTSAQVAELGSTQITGIASCGASEVVLGGGYSVPENARVITVTQNAPFGAIHGETKGWSSIVVLDEAAGQKGTKGISATLTTYAICAEVPSR